MIDLARLPTRVEGKNLLLRRYGAPDTGALYEAARESITEVYPFLPWCHPDYKKVDSEEWILRVAEQWSKGAAYNFAILDGNDGHFLGGCGLGLAGDGESRANLGYWVRSSACGRGIATRATRLLAQFGFEALDLRRIEIVMAAHNQASKRVAVKSGARYEGRLRNRLELHGVATDCFCYSLIPSDVSSLADAG